MQIASLMAGGSLAASSQLRYMQLLLRPAQPSSCLPGRTYTLQQPHCWSLHKALLLLLVLVLSRTSLQGS
jgi:hypothetical protein